MGGSLIADLPFVSGTLQILEPKHDHSCGAPPGHHKSAVPGVNGNFVVDERLLNTAGTSRIAARLAAPCAPLKSPMTKSTCFWCITARTVSSKFIAIPRFSACTLLMWSDNMVKDLPFRGILGNDAREMTACAVPFLIVLLSRFDVARFCYAGK